MVNKDGTIKPVFTIRGKTYRVVLTKKGENSFNVWTARDTIENVDSGVKTEKTRKEWFNYWKKFN